MKNLSILSITLLLSVATLSTRADHEGVPHVAAAPATIMETPPAAPVASDGATIEIVEAEVIPAASQDDTVSVPQDRAPLSYKNKAADTTVVAPVMEVTEETIATQPAQPIDTDLGVEIGTECDANLDTDLDQDEMPAFDEPAVDAIVGEVDEFEVIK